MPETAGGRCDSQAHMKQGQFLELITTIFDTLQSISKVFFFPFFPLLADLLIMSLLYRAPNMGILMHSIWAILH